MPVTFVANIVVMQIYMKGMNPRENLKFSFGNAKQMIDFLHSLWKKVNANVKRAELMERLQVRKITLTLISSMAILAMVMEILLFVLVCQNNHTEPS